MVLHGDHTLQNLPDHSRATSRRLLRTCVVPRVYAGRPALSPVLTLWGQVPGGSHRARAWTRVCDHTMDPEHTSSGRGESRGAFLEPRTP